jgi:hypothetical protein
VEKKPKQSLDFLRIHSQQRMYYGMKRQSTLYKLAAVTSAADETKLLYLCTSDVPVRHR